ncbi:MAG: hypothetical protein ACK59A_00875 [Cyanobacteriota bacterium]
MGRFGCVCGEVAGRSTRNKLLAGGENHFPQGRIALAVTQALLAGGPEQATAFLEQLAADPAATRLLPFLQALQAILTGSRDRSLANHSDLDHTMAAEILLLINTLEQDQ